MKKKSLLPPGNRHHVVRRVWIVLLLALPMALLSASAIAEASGSALSPTTGLPTDKPYRPVLVNVSNSLEARSPWNLSEADIVYEAVIWGPGHTRYLALYNDQHPEAVGSIRGLRVYQAELRQAWDCPIVHHGGQSTEGTNIYDYYQDHEVDKAFVIGALSEGGGQAYMSSAIGYSFTRRTDRVSPHNLVANVALIVENRWPSEMVNGELTPYEPRLPGLQFSISPTQGEAAAAVIELSYDASGKYAPKYTFNEEARVYERWYDGKEQFDGETGKRIVASNVLVQVCDLSYYDDTASRPVLATAGEGPLDAFIDGTHIQGHWRRPTADDPTEYLDEKGEPIILLPGKTFIQIIPPEIAMDYEEAGGGSFRFSP